MGGEGGGGGEDLVLLYDCRSQCGYQCCSQTISAYTVLRGWEQDYVDTCLCRASAVFDTVLGGGGGAGSVGAG